MKFQFLLLNISNLIYSNILLKINILVLAMVLSTSTKNILPNFQDRHIGIDAYLSPLVKIKVKIKHNATTDMFVVLFNEAGHKSHTKSLKNEPGLYQPNII